MYTTQGKPDTLDTYTFHVSLRMPLICFLRAIPIRGNLSLVINSIGQNHCSQEKGTPDYIPSTPTDRSTRPHPVSLPLTTIEAVEKAKHLLTTSYISLLGPYLQHVISTINTCSWGPTRWSLTDTGGGYNRGGAGFPHHTPRPSQPMFLRLPPKGPTRSQVIHPTISLQLNQ
jgi:hypothetical protein